MRPARKDMIAEPEPQAYSEQSLAPSCVHHWIIDTPSGPVSQGVCRICGEEREFRNYLDSSYWDDDLTLEQVSTGGRYPTSVIPGPSVDEEEA